MTSDSVKKQNNNQSTLNHAHYCDYDLVCDWLLNNAYKFRIPPNGYDTTQMIIDFRKYFKDKIVSL